MATEHPQGTVIGLCSASATSFALCSAFLAFWGFQGSGSWHAIDLLVLLPLAVGSLALAVTPFVATRPGAGGAALGRAFFFVGIVSAWLAICIAAILSIAGVGDMPKV